MTFPRNPIKLIIGIVILFHLLLFSIATPPAPQKKQYPIPPKTTYLFPEQRSKSMTSTLNQQNIWSPLLFSFPSKMGFSHDYLMQRLQTRITFPAPERAKYFLQLSPQELFNTFTSTETKKLLSRPEKTRLPLPLAPKSTHLPQKKEAPRLRLSSNLKPRLDLPVSFSDPLNQPTQKPWVAHAKISISAYGRVEHVFLKKPIEDPELNKAFLLWIYNMHFKSTPHSTTGTIELFSPYPKTDANP